MRLLVTGGCGFIGSNFIHYWANKYPSDSIEVIDKLTYAGHRENIATLTNIKLHVGDICDKSLVEKVVKDKDIIVHFAAESHVDRSISKPDDFIQTNIVGTYTLLQAALNSSIKLFHHVSTDEVYGSLSLDDNTLFNENTPYNPHSPYSASKASSDHLVRAYFDTYSLPVTISNTSNNYGPYQDPEKLIPRFITNIIVGQKVSLMGNGENIRDWIYVDDHCNAIDLIIHSAITNKKIIGETFCVGSNEQKTNMMITEEILKYFDKDESWIEFIPHRLGHDLRYAIDASKIRNLLGWVPAHSFVEGFTKTIQWYQNNMQWWKPLKL